MTHDELQRELAGLQALRSLSEGLFQQGLALLRDKYGDGPVELALRSETLLTPPVTSQTLRDQVTVGVNVGGSIYGHVFLNGYRDRSRAELLAGYLGRLSERCAVMPLQGAASERDTDDTLRLGLDQLYTELATDELVERERFDVATLAEEPLQAYLQAHTQPGLLPAAQRTVVRGLSLSSDETPIDELALRKGKADTFAADLQRTNAKELLQQFQSWQSSHPQVAFFGPQLVTEAIAAHRCLVLLGEPGGGKSTALRYLARNLARAGVEPEYDLDSRIAGWGPLGKLLPIFVPLLPLARRLATTSGRRGTEIDLWNYLVEQLQPGGAYVGLADAVMQEIDAGNVILLLDGLDEVASEGSRHQVVQAVSAFAEAHRACRVVVSCRIRAYDVQINPDNRRWQLAGWPTVTLADLTLAQMYHFVGAWYAAVSDADPVIAVQRDERIAELRAALDARPDLRSLGVRPLLLTIMALVHLRQRNLPEDRASLYRECVEILLERWEIRGKEDTAYRNLMAYIDLEGLEVKALRPLLTKVALAAHEVSSHGSPGILQSAELQVMVQRFLREKGHSNPYEGALKFLDYTDKRAGLLHATGAGNDYQFAHMTFQEYLAGLALVGDENPVKAILDRRSDERWRIPIFLGIGHSVSENMPSTFLMLLSELTADAYSERGQRDLILAAELAEDLRWQRLSSAGFNRLKRDLARDLAAVVEGSVLPASERIRAGELLAGLDDPRDGVCTLAPAMVPIAGGSFIIGLTAKEIKQLPKDEQSYFERSQNNQVVSVAPFEMARYPVTNAQYQHFVKAGGYYDHNAPWWSEAARMWLQRDDAAANDLDPWQRRQFKDRPEFWDDPRFGKARTNYPVVGVNWYEAMAFCAWLTQRLDDGYVYRLPSEAEWEWAARGAERRTYPWSAGELDGERANYGSVSDGTTAVGCFPVGATPTTGLLDMAGNVWEWTRSEYQPYPYDPTDGRDDGLGLAQKSFTIRGGYWGFNPFYLRAAFRVDYTPDDLGQGVGFRLARHLKV